jgi:hypothetical protein
MVQMHKHDIEPNTNYPVIEGDNLVLIWPSESAAKARVKLTVLHSDSRPLATPQYGVSVGGRC